MCATYAHPTCSAVQLRRDVLDGERADGPWKVSKMAVSLLRGGEWAASSSAEFGLHASAAGRHADMQACRHM